MSAARHICMARVHSNFGDTWNRSTRNPSKYADAACRISHALS
jgi:hypothetical protein